MPNLVQQAPFFSCLFFGFLSGFWAENNYENLNPVKVLRNYFNKTRADVAAAVGKQLNFIILEFTPPARHKQIKGGLGKSWFRLAGRDVGEAMVTLFGPAHGAH